MTHRPDSVLRNALRANAAFSGACGLSAVLAFEALATTLGPPAGVVIFQGASLALFSAALVWLATRAEIRLGFALAVVVLDLLWVAGTAAPLLASGVLTPVGVPVVATLAVIVLGFAGAQYLGVRRVRDASEASVATA
ncbi:MAG: hypothetical protein JRG82_05425 [Deltaproteobacteria bacterium]|nr:hypothetical protein [Deltaproteobacteria bacterium]